MCVVEDYFFFATVFLAGAFFAAGLAAGFATFFAVTVRLPPLADLAAALSCFFLRAALFLLMTPFFTALSIEL